MIDTYFFMYLKSMDEILGIHSGPNSYSPVLVRLILLQKCSY